MAAINKNALLVTLLVILRRRRRRRQKKVKARKGKTRKFWVRPINLDRSVSGAYQSTFLTARAYDRGEFFRFVRMSPERFDHLLSLMREKLARKYHIRAPISPEERLAVTLRYLATGDSQTSLAFAFKLGRSTINGIIGEVCDEIWNTLAEYVRTPSTTDEWKKIADDFLEIWNMPHCIGALDGKHVGMRKPAYSGSLWHNYKGFFSMVLLAICDAKYCFSFIDVGEYGSNNDSGILNNSKMGKKFRNDKMNVPSSEKINGTDFEVPYFLVGDEIFPLQNWLMRPFPGRALNSEKRKIFNYRLSRARRIIENTFGIMVARWRIFQKPIEAEPRKVEKIILAAVALHNYLTQTDNACYTPRGFIDNEDSNGKLMDGHWRNLINGNSLVNVNPVRNSRYQKSALETRDALASYLVTEEGSVPWQWNHVRRTGQDCD